MAIQHKDVAKQTIKPGDFFVYAAMRGQSASLKFGVVTRLEEKPHPWRDDYAQPTIRAITVEPGYSDGPDWVIQKNGQEVAFNKLHHAFVVPVQTLPKEVVAVLRKYAAMLPEEK